MIAASHTTGPLDAAMRWARACELLRERLGEGNVARWIGPLRCTWTDGLIALEAPDPAACNQIRRHFLPAIEDAVARVEGRPCPVRLCTPETRSLPFPTRAPRPEYTFETFVVAESNRNACESARALVREQAAPLLLCGPTGVGKTHLLHAAAHALGAIGVAVACLAAAEFTEALVAAYQADAEAGFWLALAPLGALLLDDIHSLAGREQVQEHLGDGLARWVQGPRLLVLTSDRPADDVPVLARRWQERFGNGRIARIEPPEPALRLAILQLKARALGLELDLGLARRIAAHVQGSIRRLEGALTRLVARVRLSGRGLDDALVAETLPELRAMPSAPPSLDRIMEETAAAFGVTARALRGRSRRAEVRLPRQVAIFLARKLAGRPATELGEAFGRDRATVGQAARAIAGRARSDPRLAAHIAEIERQLIPSG